ncbi:unnamed protein product [Amoebophrya sp. A25]|nr:unnamed protein product [Amoebophrya sp. A25]|eukprot:GSA25T00021304001.1
MFGGMFPPVFLVALLLGFCFYRCAEIEGGKTGGHVSPRYVQPLTGSAESLTGETCSPLIILSRMTVRLSHRIPISQGRCFQSRQALTPGERGSLLDTSPAPKQKQCAQVRETVMDIGMNTGGDTYNLLRAGYRVIAVEANPDMIWKVRRDPYFSAAIDTGRLSIVHTGIVWPPTREELFFYVNRQSVWSSFDPQKGCLHDSYCKRISVPLSNCAALIREHSRGCPVKYMKIDIEHNDLSCLQSMHAAGSLPPTYISIESRTPAVFDTLEKLGYTAYKLVDQRPFRNNGRGQHSGPFGEKSKDQRVEYSWRTLEEVRKDVCNDRGDGIPHPWCDVHAKLST